MKWWLKEFALLVGVLAITTESAYAAEPIVVPHSATADTVAKQVESLPRAEYSALVEAPPEFSAKAPEGAEKVHFVLEKVIIEGSTVYSAAELHTFYANLIGKDVTLADMYNVVSHITERYLDNNYLLTRAYLSPQRIGNGTVRIRVVEGYIKHVHWTGEPLDSGIAKRMADRLLKMHPLTGKGLESIVLLLNDLASVHVEATLMPDEKDKGTGAVDVVMNVQRKRLSAQLDTNSYSSRYLGIWQSSLETDLMGAFTPVDKLAVNLTSSLDPGTLAYGRAEYTLPINSFGTALNVGVNRSYAAPAYTLEPDDIRSNSMEGWIGASQPLIRSREENLTVASQFNLNNVKTDVAGSTLYDDRVRTLQLTANYERADNWNGVNNIETDLYQGFNILGASRTGSTDLSRADGHSEFLKATFNASRLQTISSHWSVLAAATGQWSDAQLLSSEQFGYGGQAFGRAYDSAEINGDQGLAGSAELRYAAPISTNISLQPYLFYDIGKVWNYGADDISGASAGPGFRVQYGTYALLDFNVAKPLTLPDSAPKLGASNNDPRINLSLRLTY